MNPFGIFRNYIIGGALSETEDVFERSRIRLTFNLSVFLFMMSLVFGMTLILNPIPWQVYNFYFTNCAFLLLFVVFRRTRKVGYAGYIFLFVQVYLMTLNGFMNKFEMLMDGALWAMMGLVFTFFVLGKKWGFFLVAYIIVQTLMPGIDKLTGNALLRYTIAPEDIPPHEPVAALIPLAIITYALVQIIDTRSEAERQIRDQKSKLESGKRELEAKNKDITDSINYARKIQFAILPPAETIMRGIPLSFFFYRPKDIVSGDFYWFHELDDKRYILVCADCTGHGVPGALMTVIGSNLLNQIVASEQTHHPGAILSRLDSGITGTLRQEKYATVFDGMDASVISVDKGRKQFIFASAKRSALFIRGQSLKEIKGAKFSLGGMRSGLKQFEEVTVSYREDDVVYFYTDGITDQFGGPRGKKLSSKRFREMILKYSGLPMHEQKERIGEEFDQWKGDLEQVDDVLVAGIKF